MSKNGNIRGVREAPPLETGWLPVVLLMLLTAAVCIPSLRGEFLLDDDVNIIENKTLRSVDGLREIWLVPGATQQYYPVTYSVWWAGYQWWGTHTLGYHIVNVVAHTVAVLLVWRVLVKLRVPGAWFAAAIFAVHPVCVESVAWITELKNVLSLALAAGSVLCYLHFDPLDGAADESAAGRSSVGVLRRGTAVVCRGIVE